MKKAADILKEMGFRKDAPVSAQDAFIRHLVKVANMPNSPALSSEKPGEPVQLSFDLAQALPEKKIS